MELICQICNEEYQHLGSHIWHKHKIKAREYKRMFGLDYNHALITPEIKEKKQIQFNKHRDKYLKNLQTEKFRFKKGEVNRKYFSQESIEKALSNIKKIEDNRVKMMCPICEVKYNNLQIHLNTKHGLKIMGWKNG